MVVLGRTRHQDRFAGRDDGRLEQRCFERDRGQVGRSLGDGCGILSGRAGRVWGIHGHGPHRSWCEWLNPVPTRDGGSASRVMSRRRRDVRPTSPAQVVVPRVGPAPAFAGRHAARRAARLRSPVPNCVPLAGYRLVWDGGHDDFSDGDAASGLLPSITGKPAACPSGGGFPPSTNLTMRVSSSDAAVA